MRDVPIRYIQEEFVEGMVHLERNTLVVMKGVQTMLLMEEFVSNMEPKLRLRYAAIKDVLIKLSREEFVGNMGQGKRLAKILANRTDVTSMCRKKEFVSDTGQH